MWYSQMRYWSEQAGVEPEEIHTQKKIQTGYTCTVNNEFLQ